MKKFLIGLVVGWLSLYLVGNIRIISSAWETTDGKFLDYQETTLFDFLASRGYKRTMYRTSDWKEANNSELMHSSFTFEGMQTSLFIYPELYRRRKEQSRRKIGG